MPRDSASAQDLRAHRAPAETRHRVWGALTLSVPRGAVTHWPLWMEDPFVDKGHGRTGRNVYHLGWEDFIAVAYVYPRYTLNWLLLPVSATFAPPWHVMESDGRISREGTGMGFDAARADSPRAGDR